MFHLRKPLFSPMKTQRVVLPAFTNVVANSTAQILLPAGYRYKSIFLVYGGTFTPALMTKIRLYADSDQFQTFSGTWRDMINQFDRMPAASTYNTLCIPFERAGMNEEDARYLTCINTGRSGRGVQSRSGIENLRIEVDIGAATNPTLVAYAHVMDNNPEQSRMLPRIDSYIENVSATGEWLHQGARKLLGDKVRPYVGRFHFNDTLANITNIRIKENGTDTVNELTTVAQYSQVRELLRAPQTGWVSHDTGDQGEYFNTYDPIHDSSFDLYTTHAAVNAALNVVYESFGPSIQ